MNPNPDRPTTRRVATLGVAGGLLAGGAIGLLTAAPTFTSAASTTETTTPAAETTEPAEEPAEEPADEPAAEPATEPEATERVGRVREALQDLVDDGTITAAQADAVAAQLAAELPPRGEFHGDGRRGGGHPGFDGEITAEIIGIEVDELREQLRAGSSIADIASANGVDPQTVIDALVAEAQEHLALAVENGRLTEAEAADRAGTIEERVTARVDGERPARP